MIEKVMDAIANPPPLADVRVRLVGLDILNTAEDKKAETRIRNAERKAVQEFPPSPEPKPSRRNGRGVQEQNAARMRR